MRYHFTSTKMTIILKSRAGGGPWPAQSVKHLTLDFNADHDLMVWRWSPTSGSTLSVEPACDSLPLSLKVNILKIFLKISKFKKLDNNS